MDPCASADRPLDYICSSGYNIYVVVDIIYM